MRKPMIVLAALLVASCKVKDKKAIAGPDVAEVKTPNSETLLVTEGENSQPSYNSKGDRLVFVSARRTGHAHPQVYEKDLQSGTERRITFQNGNTEHPRFDPTDKWIVYSSSTDELKEYPPLLNLDQLPPSQLPNYLTPPMEVYVHSLSGLEIKRVTKRPGFDGEARISPNGKKLTWTRVIGDNTQIMALPESKPEAQVLNNLGQNPTDYITSMDGKISAWIEWDKKYAVTKLMLKRGKKGEEIAADRIAIKSDVTFSPDSKWLLWAQKDPDSQLYDLWGFEMENNCLHHFSFTSNGDRRDPVVSPDMKFLTYTLVSRGRSRIAQVPFPETTGSCPSSP